MKALFAFRGELPSVNVMRLGTLDWSNRCSSGAPGLGLLNINTLDQGPPTSKHFFHLFNVDSDPDALSRHDLAGTSARFYNERPRT